MTTSNILFLSISAIIPRRPVDVIAATNERNFRQSLSFIIVASPLLFVDAVIPKLGEQAQRLRKIFFEQLTVSVVFMIMLYLSIAMTKVFTRLGGVGEGGVGIDVGEIDILDGDILPIE